MAVQSIMTVGRRPGGSSPSGGPVVAGGAGEFDEHFRVSSRCRARRALTSREDFDFGKRARVGEHDAEV